MYNPSTLVLLKNIYSRLLLNNSENFQDWFRIGSIQFGNKRRQKLFTRSVLNNSEVDLKKQSRLIQNRSIQFGNKRRPKLFTGLILNYSEVDLK